MTRIARLDTPGLLHHIMIRGIERRKIFNDDKDRYLQELLGYIHFHPVKFPGGNPI